MGMIWQKLLAPEPAAAGYSCTITIGNSSGAYGYDTGALISTFGSIDAEPISGEILVGCAWAADPYLVVAFDGDLTGLIGSLDVWLGGVNYGGAGAWSYDAFTAFETVSSAPSATSGTILLEIK